MLNSHDIEDMRPDEPSDEMKPCPFCGGEPGMVQQTKVNWAVMCHVCGAEGGWSNPSDAIALWNRRATPQQEVPVLTAEQRWMEKQAFNEWYNAKLAQGIHPFEIAFAMHMEHVVAAPQPSPKQPARQKYQN